MPADLQQRQRLAKAGRCRTWFLSILAGHHRYAHITVLRGDGVSPQILGMSKIVSEDALRRALARMSEDESRDWLRPQLLSSAEAALNAPWILDIDTTIKTLFGKQSGAGVSYNPHKPRLAYLLRESSAHGSRCGCQPRQAARGGSCASRTEQYSG